MVKKDKKLNCDIEIDTKREFNIWVWVVIFAVAFAYMESAVVIYLRKIYFDGKFSFPLIVIWEHGQRIVDPLVRVELGREIDTLIILAAVCWVAGKNRFQRFGFFMLAFGIWDIFYYIWLYALSGWPESLLSWDLLFYVPLPWVGPVITPILISLAMSVAGSLFVFYDVRGNTVTWQWYDTAVELLCGIMMIAAFCWDWKNILQVPGDLERTGIPNPFAWWLYLPAYITAVGYFALKFRKIMLSGF